MLHVISILLVVVSTYAIPILETTDSEVSEVATSTAYTQTFHHATTDLSIENTTTPALNVSSVPFMTTTKTLTPNAAVTNVGPAGKSVNGRANSATTYSSGSSGSSDSSDPGLSSGAIAGIVIGIIVLLCCCGCLGVCKKSGHWENRQVWVEH